MAPLFLNYHMMQSHTKIKCKTVSIYKNFNGIIAKNSPIPVVCPGLLTLVSADIKQQPLLLVAVHCHP